MNKKYRIGFIPEEERSTDGMFGDDSYKRHRIGFDTEPNNTKVESPLKSTLNQLNYGLNSFALFILRRPVKAMLSAFCVLGMLSSFAEKRTVQNDKAVLTAGAFGVPIVKVEINKGNKDTDFTARTPLSEKFRQMAELVQESPKNIQIIQQSLKGRK